MPMQAGESPLRRATLPPPSITPRVGSVEVHVLFTPWPPLCTRRLPVRTTGPPPMPAGASELIEMPSPALSRTVLAVISMRPSEGRKPDRVIPSPAEPEMVL